MQFTKKTKKELSARYKQHHCMLGDSKRESVLMVGIEGGSC